MEVSEPLQLLLKGKEAALAIMDRNIQTAMEEKARAEKEKKEGKTSQGEGGRARGNGK